MPKNSAAYYALRPEQYKRLKGQAVARKKKIRQWWYRVLNAYKQQQGCAECSEKDPLFLEFDHDAPEDKIATIAHMVNRDKSPREIWAEVRKCTVRCIRCHRRKTAKQFNWYTEVAPLAELEDALCLERSVPVA